MDDKRIECACNPDTCGWPMCLEEDELEELLDDIRAEEMGDL